MTPTPPDEAFYTSSYSSQGGECVEFALTDDHGFVRDSKNPRQACLSASHREMKAFIAAVLP